MENCLGLSYICGIYLETFGAGDLLTVIGLFFTGYQFIGPVERFRLYNRGINNMIIFWLIMIPIILSVTGIIIPYLPGEALPLIGYSDFWQLLSLFIIVLIGVTFVLKALVPLKTITNTKKFLDIFVVFLGKGGKYTVAIGSELKYIIKQIVQLVDKGDSDMYNVLRLSMDKGLTDNIIQEQFFTITQILGTYTDRKKINDRDIDDLQEEFLSTIIEKSLNNKDSIISRELRGELYGGINRGEGMISQQIFKDFDFINRYGLLSRKRYVGSYKAEEQRTKDYAINYSKFWKLAVNSFFKQERNDKGDVTKKHITNNIGFYKDLYRGLRGFSGYNGILMENYKDRNIIFEIMNNIYHGIYDNAEEILKHYNSGNISKFEVKNMIGISNIEPTNFFEAIAIGCYHLLETISYIDETEENVWNIRTLVDEILLKDTGGDEAYGKITNLIKERLNYLIGKQISENNLRGYYPNMTRIFFHIYGWHIFTNKIDDGEDKIFCMNVLKLLEETLPKLNSGIFRGIEKKDNDIDEDLQENRKKQAEKIAADILPYGVVYSEKNNTLTYYFGSKLDKSILDLSEVKNNRIVILNHEKKEDENI